MIETLLARSLTFWDLDDPLLRFIERPDNRKDCDPGETVNLAALFSSAGAVQDASQGGNGREQLNNRLRNADNVAGLASATGWRPCLPDESLRSGILLLEPSTSCAQSLAPDETRAAFQERGVALTAYDSGVLRLSMPTTPLQSEELAVLSSALTAIT
jgi:hypothetical protein